MEPPVTLLARTVLLDPFRNAAAVKPFAVRVLSAREAYAEKLRAALSRRDPAIRDFFDLDHAFAVGNVSASDATLNDQWAPASAARSPSSIHASATSVSEPALRMTSVDSLPRESLPPRIVTSSAQSATSSVEGSVGSGGAPSFMGSGCPG